MYTTETWNLLIKHLAGETTAAEAAQVQAWLQESDVNREQYRQLQKLWEESETDIAEAFTPNIDLAWQKVSKRVNLQATQPAAKPVAKVVPMYQWTLRVAAVLVLALGAVWFVYRSSEQGMFGNQQLAEQSTTSGQTKVLLADGTQVWLNRNSKLRYPDTFEGNTREVYLEGEAFFDVQRNPEKPFLIHAQQSVTQVLGTSFNVEAYENQPEVKVTVVTGKVSLAEEGKQSEVVLTPGEQGI
ncbi:MAG: FecR domain-containing protein, partial [Hymenobacteraceae bacterium]|nr:FecR domain-containing protein [Hymenobacteraceae bacterium]